MQASEGLSEGLSESAERCQRHVSFMLPHQPPSTSCSTTTAFVQSASAGKGNLTVLNVSSWHVWSLTCKVKFTCLHMHTRKHAHTTSTIIKIRDNHLFVETMPTVTTGTRP